MFEFLADWPRSDQLFLLAGVAGGLSFTIWLLLQFIGGAGDGADSMDADGGDGDISGEADISFTVLSFQGISSFLTMFGFVGLSARREMETSIWVAIVVGCCAGLAMSFLIARLFSFFRKLQSSGTMDPNQAAGKEGTVYLRIPQGGTGKVQLAVQGRLQVMEAVSESSSQLETGERVRVSRVIDGHTLVVEALQAKEASEI